MTKIVSIAKLKKKKNNNFKLKKTLKGGKKHKKSLKNTNIISNQVLILTKRYIQKVIFSKLHTTLTYSKIINKRNYSLRTIKKSIIFLKINKYCTKKIIATKPEFYISYMYLYHGTTKKMNFFRIYEKHSWSWKQIACYWN